MYRSIRGSSGAAGRRVTYSDRASTAPFLRTWTRSPPYRWTTRRGSTGGVLLDAAELGELRFVEALEEVEGGDVLVQLTRRRDSEEHAGHVGVGEGECDGERRRRRAEHPAERYELARRGAGPDRH